MRINMKKILIKPDLEKFIQALQNDNAIYAPIDRDGIIKFGQIESPNDIVLDFTNTIKPAKEIIFEQTRKMFKYRFSKDGSDLTPPELEVSPQVIFGTRPCDAEALAILDPLFGGQFKDPYYLETREKTIIIGLACNKPSHNCFCTSLGNGSGPGSSKGMDLIFTDLGDKYFVEPVTEKGEKVIKANAKLFSEPDKTDEENQDKLMQDASSQIKREMKLEGKPEKLAGLFESDYWAEIYKKCLGCGICTYLCPTCHCFDITDEVQGKKGQRVRTWDSCMFPEYTVHASGYNPRPSRKNRLRNRVYHKYRNYIENFGLVQCCGCGRCINYCPVNVDIINIINDLEGVSE
jgi:ferredoxin